MKMKTDSIQYIKLIKLMYLSDRKSVELYDRTISNDDLFSMDNGPVLSRLLNLIHGDCAKDLQDRWNKCFSTVGYDIRISGENAKNLVDRLSKAETNIIDGVVGEFGQRDVWDLINNYLHMLPEWKDPHGSSIPIKLADLMRALDKNEDEISAVLDENEIYKREMAVCKGIRS